MLVVTNPTVLTTPPPSRISVQRRVAQRCAHVGQAGRDDGGGGGRQEQDERQPRRQRRQPRRLLCHIMRTSSPPSPYGETKDIWRLPGRGPGTGLARAYPGAIGFLTGPRSGGPPAAHAAHGTLHTTTTVLGKEAAWALLYAAGGLPAPPHLTPGRAADAHRGHGNCWRTVAVFVVFCTTVRSHRHEDKDTRGRTGRCQ